IPQTRRTREWPYQDWLRRTQELTDEPDGTASWFSFLSPAHISWLCHASCSPTLWNSARKKWDRIASSSQPTPSKTSTQAGSRSKDHSAVSRPYSLPLDPDCRRRQGSKGQGAERGLLRNCPGDWHPLHTLRAERANRVGGGPIGSAARLTWVMVCV